MNRAGQPGFTGSRFTAKQDAGIGAGNATGKFDRFPPHRGGGGQIGFHVHRAEGFLECLDFSLEHSPLGDLLGEEPDLGRLERLGEIVAGAALHRFDGALYGCIRSDHNNPHPGVLVHEDLDVVEAVDIAAEADVEKDQVKRLVGGLFEGFVDCGGGGDFVPFDLQAHAHHEADVFLVVHNQDSQGAKFCAYLKHGNVQQVPLHFLVLDSISQIEYQAVSHIRICTLSQEKAMLTRFFLL